MKKALVAAAVAGAFAAPSLMAAELSTNIYWSTAVTAQETTTTVAGVIGYLKANEIDNSEYLVIGISISAILICIYWVNLLENYRKLNSGKFKVIHEIEKELPLNLFKYEWEKLGKGNDPKLYKKLSNVEKVIPLIFGILFLFVIVFELINIFKLIC